MAFITAGLLMGLAACRHSSPQATILPTGVSLRAGDIVFRRGLGAMSHAVTTADRGGKYSHVGVVADSCGVLMVVHAVPGELDYEGDVDRVKMDTPERFFSTAYAAIGEVFRPQDSVRATQVAAQALEVYKRRVMFDHDYDDTDTTKMYCTELVTFALRRAGYDVSSLVYSDFRIPGMNVHCILPSAVARLPFLRSVSTF